MKIDNLIEMLEHNLDYLRYLDKDTDVFVDLGGRERALVGLVNHKDGVLLKISERPSEKQYFRYGPSEDGYAYQVEAVDMTHYNINEHIEHFPGIYFEATLVT